MKRTWIIPAVICLLLLAAWPLRWEKGPVRNEVDPTLGKITYSYFRDRWTGQEWAKMTYYIYFKKCSETYPVLSPEAIETEKEGYIKFYVDLYGSKDEAERQINNPALGQFEKEIIQKVQPTIGKKQLEELFQKAAEEIIQEAQAIMGKKQFEEFLQKEHAIGQAKARDIFGKNDLNPIPDAYIHLDKAAEEAALEELTQKA